MFTIGEFSHIARVTTRLLRYYDQLGLLSPAEVDASSGYRRYSAEQLPRLNRILALKEMGFSLDEISDLVEAEVPAAEMRGMLTVKRSELARGVEADLLRLRLIESRIDSVDDIHPPEAFDLRPKTVPLTPWIYHRFTCHHVTHAVAISDSVLEVAQRLADPVPRPHRIAIGHGDFTESDIDLELGIAVESVDQLAAQELALSDGTELRASVLPAIEAITGVRVGLPLLTSAFYATLGGWLEANDATIDGPIRELVLQLSDPTRGVEPVAEVQVPIRLDNRQ